MYSIHSLRKYSELCYDVFCLQASVIHVLLVMNPSVYISNKSAGAPVLLTSKSPPMLTIGGSLFSDIRRDDLKSRIDSLKAVNPSQLCFKLQYPLSALLLRSDVMETIPAKQTSLSNELSCMVGINFCAAFSGYLKAH